MKKLSLSTIVLTVLFAACKEKADPVPEHLTIKTLQGMMASDQWLSVLGYNDIKKPAAIGFMDTDSTGKGYYFSSEPKYENGRIMELWTGNVNNIRNLTHALKYNDEGKAVKIIFVASELNRYDSLVYDDSNRLKVIYCKRQSYGLEYPFGIYKKDTLIWDNKGNVTTHYAVPVVNGMAGKDTITTSYTYDDKINFLHKPEELFLMNYERSISYLSANNVLTQSTRYAASGLVITISNVYTYDKDNDPATASMNKKITKGGATLYNDTTDFKINYERLAIE